MKPFLHGKKPSGSVSLAGAPAPLAAAKAATLRPHLAESTAQSPAIEAIKEGDKVVRLIITCSCGERMEVECIYPAGS